MKGIVLLACLAACDGDIDSSTIDASGGGTTDGRMADVPGGVGEPANLMGITMMHNQVRAMVDTSSVAGGPLPPMVWDPDLAAHALEMVRLRLVARALLHAQVELFAAQFEQLLVEVLRGLLAKLFEFHHSTVRFTNVVCTDSLAAARRNASRASASLTPSIS